MGTAPDDSDSSLLQALARLAERARFAAQRTQQLRNETDLQRRVNTNDFLPRETADVAVVIGCRHAQQQVGRSVSQDLGRRPRHPHPNSPAADTRKFVQQIRSVLHSREQRLYERVRVEIEQVVRLLAHTDEQHRHLQRILDGEGNPASRR